MLRFAVLAILFAAVCAVPINDTSKAGDLDVIVVDNFDEYLAENPGVELIGELAKKEVQDRSQIRYTFGNHVNVERVVHSTSFNQQWPRPQQVNAKVSYPASGVGSILSFVQINVDQSSNVGRAFITSGGTGTRQISIAIEASTTTYLRFTATFYGYN